MISRLKQLVGGNKNKVAGGDINEYNYYGDQHPIRFFENDIKEVIEFFAKDTDKLGNEIENATDFYRPGIEKKNEINKLSDLCFEDIQENSLNSFDKITKFLKDPKNEEYLSKYLSTTKELNKKIICNRKDYDYFDKIFDLIYSYIVERTNYKLNFNKELIWIFLHYMYYNCEIGEKYDKAT